jgi:GNAT superfamily N-acetyltransferase
MDLPDGLTARPLDTTDARALYEVMAAQEAHDIGEVVVEEADIVGDWQRPSFDVASSTIGVFDGDTMVAWAELTDAQRCDAAVLPAYRGRGIGRELAAWLQQRARERGSEIVGAPVPVGSPGDRLLQRLGYFVRWTSWVLALPEGAEIQAQPLPDGFTLRTAGSDADRRAAFEVKEDAFLEWSERERDSFDDWLATSVHRPGFEPWNLRVVVDPDDEVVGMCLVLLAEGTGYVDQLAVRRDRRGLGLARSLLADSFAVAREHGARRSELATDTRTGALGLYERVGMVVTHEWVHRAIRL